MHAVLQANNLVFLFSPLGTPDFVSTLSSFGGETQFPRPIFVEQNLVVPLAGFLAVFFDHGLKEGTNDQVVHGDKIVAARTSPSSSTGIDVSV